MNNEVIVNAKEVRSHSLLVMQFARFEFGSDPSGPRIPPPRHPRGQILPLSPSNVQLLSTSDKTHTNT